MKVKISYNIELDDVPEHISELLNNIGTRLEAVAQATSNTAIKVKSKQFPASALLGTLGGLREELEKIDTLFADFGAILAGYEQALLAPEALIEQQEAAANAESTDEE